MSLQLELVKSDAYDDFNLFYIDKFPGTGEVIWLNKCEYAAVDSQ